MREYDTFGRNDLRKMRRLSRSFRLTPRISILMPVGVSARALPAAIDSVLGQIYDGWELCLATSEATPDELGRIVASYQAIDGRIAETRARGSGRPALCNAALGLASGVFAVLVDPDGTLAPHALLMVVLAANENRDAELFYSDEDELDERGRRRAPNFKPDWNPALLLSTGYVGRLTAFGVGAANEIEGFRPEFEGSEETDLVLRLVSRLEPSQIVHLPHVLYHQRSGMEAPEQPREGEGPADLAARVVEAGLSAADVAAHPVVGRAGVVNVRYELPKPCPEVRVIVPTTMRSGVADCLDGLLTQTRYAPLQVTIAVDERDLEPEENRRLLDEFESDPRVSAFVHGHRPFNFSCVNNAAISGDSAPLLCLLNDDVRVIEPTWLETMVAHAVQPGVGAVGARLIYPDDRIQHAGVILGAVGVAAHAHHLLPRDDPGYQSRAIADQDLSCVTAACLVIRREAFDDAGGFDEELAIAFNDVDLCIRLRARGWRIVLAAEAELYHDESVSVGAHDAPARREQFAREHRLMKARWGELLKRDPHYSPNLDLRRPGLLAFPPRVVYPWRGSP